MATDTEIKTRIAEKARERFFQYGFGKVTMDELAEELGMSKKTLYKHFPNKEQILWEIYNTTTEEYRRACEAIYTDETKGYAQRLTEVLELGSGLWMKLSSAFLADIRKSAPEIWKALDGFKRESIFGRFGEFFTEGIERGVFRSDIERRLVLVIYTRVIQSVLNPEAMSQLSFSPPQIFDAVIKVLYEGVLTDAGREALHGEPLKK